MKGQIGVNKRGHAVHGYADDGTSMYDNIRGAHALGRKYAEGSAQQRVGCSAATFLNPSGLILWRADIRVHVHIDAVVHGPAVMPPHQRGHRLHLILLTPSCPSINMAADMLLSKAMHS